MVTSQKLLLLALIRDYKYYRLNQNIGQIGFAIGTGRCGTKFIHTILSQHKAIKSTHERTPLNDTFHRYCKWYELNIDNCGFLETKKRLIIQDLQKFKFSFESSAYLSLSIFELNNYFNCKFILLIRNPINVINSYIRKGWYNHEFYLNNHNSIPSFQPDNKHFHHFLGRTLPKGEEFEMWNNLTQVGKLAWYWKTLNLRVLRQFEDIDNKYYRIQKLEEFDHKAYQKICDFFQINPELSLKKFNEISNSKPNSNNIQKEKKIWNKKEKNDFEFILDSETLKYLGY